jgi:fumarylacetoacetase
MSLQIDETHDPARTSWVVSANGHREFPVQNLPFGIFSPRGSARRAGVAIGDCIIDLRGLTAEGFVSCDAASVLHHETLNALFALPSEERVALRRRLSEGLSDSAYRDRLQPYLHKASSCTLHLPAQIGDYTDFYVGIHHATNVGRLFRPDNPLLPNYKHVPIGYHGRASSVRSSGVPVRRPQGQLKPPDRDRPIFAPSQRLDYELELGLWVGQGNALGQPVSIAEAWKHIAGLCLLNDWSARDIQAWEYQPLGPFLAKNFQTTVSPWVVTTEALAPFRQAASARSAEDAALPYLTDTQDQQFGGLALELSVSLLTKRMRYEGMAPFRVSQGDASGMYWTLAQILTHHTSNGCNLLPGDLLGTGTLSMAEREGFGSLLELTLAGSEPIALPTGETRSFLEDGDEVLLSGVACTEGRTNIGFGACRAMIVPAP